MDFMQFNNISNRQNLNVSRSKAGRRGKTFGFSNNEDNLFPVKQRSQANARERDRTHSVNTAFSTLRTLIPTEPKDRKLSKIETLRLASSYISHLGTQLMAGPIDQPCLRFLKAESEVCSSSRYQVCTFCMAHKKTSRQFEDEYECGGLENQIYLDSGSSFSQSPTLMSGEDLSNIYY